jgi:hypothetical protein
MGVDTNKLTTMAQNAPELSANIGQSISTIDDALDELDSQRDAVQVGVCGTTKTLAIAYIDVMLGILRLVEPTAYFSPGPGFGTIAWSDPGPIGNLSEWGFYKLIPNPIPPFLPPFIPFLLYYYTPGIDPILDVLVDDYAFGNDQLTRPLTDGATYGLIPNLDVLGTGRSILRENQDKLDAAPAVYNRYST